MDAAKIQKIIAMNRYRNNQLLNNLIFYTASALICSVLFSSPFWLSSLSSLPKLVSVLFSSKSVFVIGSLIIMFLVGESKALTSESAPPPSEVYNDEYVSVSRSLWGAVCGHEEKKREMKREKCFGERVEIMHEEMEKKVAKGKVLDEEENLSLPELNKRADDFIARVNRQRRLEANY